MADTHPTTWLLLDGKASHHSQIAGVAERLGWPCVQKQIGYNRLALFANFGARLWHLDAPSRASIAPPWPDLVIAAGRRSAPVSLAIKKRSPRTRLVHLMWPDTAAERFSLIAVPEHDPLTHSGANVLRTFGAPSALSTAKLAMEAARWQPHVQRLPSPRIAVLIGGSGLGIDYGTEDFKTLASYISAEAERLGGSLLITTSPRTDEAAEKIIKPILTVPHLFHRFKSGADNPYHAFLGLAHAIIATADSISMCSEAAATHKPLYIFTPPHMKKDKGGFREMLFARNIAKPHTYPIRFDWQPALMPDAASAVAQAIRNLLIQ